jgi:EAL and modified HD-GYP domain-containing signal transduction protein
VQLTYVGRQPIFDEGLDVVGYELLYRAGEDDDARYLDEEAATLSVVENAVIEFGLDALVENGRAFVNVPWSFLVDERYRVVDPARCVLELANLREVDPGMVDVLARVRAEGYTVALDGFTGVPEHWYLLDQLDIVKVDVSVIEGDELVQMAGALKGTPVTTVAMRVENDAEFAVCRDLGFDLFQGFFFARPTVFHRSTISPDRMAASRLLMEIHRPDVDARDVAEVIRRDVGLTYRLLSVVNSSFYGLRNRVENVPQAVMLLGLGTIQNFASLLALAGVGGKPSELLTSVMVRARMCELLAERHLRADTPAAFTVGLLSLLGALMDMTEDQILEHLPLSERLGDALARRQGPLGGLLNTVEAYERADTDALERSGIAPEELTDCYVDAVAWAAQMRTLLPASPNSVGIRRPRPDYRVRYAGST